MKRVIGFSLIFLFAFLENVEAQSGFMDHHYTWTEYYAWGWSSHRGTERNTFDSTVVEINGKY